MLLFWWGKHYRSWFWKEETKLWKRKRSRRKECVYLFYFSAAVGGVCEKLEERMRDRWWSGLCHLSSR